MEILWLENQHGKSIDNLYGTILSCCLLWKINAQALREYYASSRKNDTEKITICHGKMLLIPTHYNVYNIIYMYICIRKIVRKIVTYLLTFNCYLISRKIIVTSLVGIKCYTNNNVTEKIPYQNATENLSIKMLAEQ